MPHGSAARYHSPPWACHGGRSDLVDVVWALTGGGAREFKARYWTLGIFNFCEGRQRIKLLGLSPYTLLDAGHVQAVIGMREVAS
jgi:hypothetical protein